MIALSRLNLSPLRCVNRTNLQLIRDLFKILQQTAPHLPPQTPALSCFVLGEVACYIGEGLAGVEGGERFFLSGVLFAEDVADVYGGCGFEFGGG